MKNIVFILLFFTFIGVLIGANIYLSRRFAWYFGFESAARFYILFATLTIFMIGGIIAFTNSMTFPGSLMYSMAAITMGIVLYLLLSTLMVDVFHFIIKLQPRIYGLLAIGLTLIFSIVGIFTASNLKVTKIEIPIKGLTSEIKAMHMSDIHIGHCRGKKFLQKIVDKTNNQNPDVVFLTGDLFDGRIRLTEENLSPLKQLNVPVFFVEGNHDKYTGVGKIKQYLRNINVHVLENEVTKFSELQIIGLNHMLADNNSVDMHATSVRLTIKNVLQNLDVERTKPTVLLHHSPDGVQYASEKGVDLYLAGHTHAGQLFPVNYIARLLFPYNKGLHIYNGTRIFVSEGAGTFGPPMRLGTKSEITLITLKPE